MDKKLPDVRIEIDIQTQEAPRTLGKSKEIYTKPYNNQTVKTHKES